MVKAINIGKSKVTLSSDPFVIAEIGINHNGSVSLGKEIIQAAYENGADAVKFQTYITDKRFDNKNLKFINFFKNMELSFEKEKILWDYAKKFKKKIFSTPFDKESFNFCLENKVDAIKVASFETTNKNLLNSLLKFKKTVFISTGQNKKHEIQKIYNLFGKNRNQICLMHCISSYPTLDKNANINRLKNLSKISKYVLGYSDHTTNKISAAYAFALGARFFEKHFTINKKLKGPDHKMSITPRELFSYKKNLLEAKEILGDSKFYLLECEKFIFKNVRRKN